MYHHSKLITKFVSFPPRTRHIIKCDGLFCDRLGIFCPNDIRLSNPHGLLSHDSSLFLAERGEGNLSLFLYIIIFHSCQEQWKFVMQGIIVPVQQRPPTKRVLLLSPSPVILTLTLPPTASTCTDAPSFTCVPPIQMETLLPDDSTSPDMKRLPELSATKLSLSSWLENIKNTTAMWQNAINVSVNGTWHHGSHATRNSRFIIVTSLLCSHLYKVNYYSIAQPTFMIGCAGILHPKNNPNQEK